MNVEGLPKSVSTDSECERTKCRLYDSCPFGNCESICMVLESRHSLIDIGHGHHVLFVDGVDDKIIGLYDFHRSKHGHRTCVGFVGWRGPRNAHWDLEQIDPLTLSPSLLCSCSDHGYIRYGQWESV